MAKDVERIGHLRAALRREEDKLIRQANAQKATQGLIEMLKEQIEVEERKR